MTEVFFIGCACGVLIAAVGAIAYCVGESRGIKFMLDHDEEVRTWDAKQLGEELMEEASERFEI